MARAMRIDKLSLAGLRATLELYLPPHDPFAEIPVLRMLGQPLAALSDRTAGFVDELKARTTLEITTRKSSSFAGGGTLPMRKIPSIAVVLRHSDMPADQLAQRLRMGTPAVVARIKDDAVVIDLRTVQPSETAALIEAIVEAAPA